MATRRLNRLHRVGLFIATAAVPVFGQTPASENGRAFDAAGSSNDVGSSALGGSFDPLSTTTSLNINAFTDPNLRNLGAQIDINNTLYVPSTGLGAGGVNPFAVQSNSVLQSPSQPFGFSAGGVSSASPYRPFEVAPISRFGLPNVSTSPSSFSRSAFSLTLPPPTRSFSNTITGSGLGGNPFSALGDANSLAAPLSFDVEDRIGFDPTFAPPTIRPSTGVPPSKAPPNELVKSLVGEDGQIYANFGSSPSAGVADNKPVQAELDEQLRKLTEFRESTPELPTPPKIGSGLPDQPLKPAFPTGVADVFSGSIPDNSFIQKTLRQAKQISKGTPGLDQSIGDPVIDEFGLAIPKTAPAGPWAPQGLPGGEHSISSMYGEMQDAVHWLKRLGAQQKKLAANASKAPVLADSLERARSFVRRTEDAPITTFAGDGRHPADQFSREAEASLKSGDYAHAAAQYEVVMVTDRDNPLLLLGQGHAYIGGGDYFRAFRKITAAIQEFPEVAYFKIDLNEFITDADLLEVRRADLERRLAEREDYRFRFLLGYIEMNSGLRAFGIANLRKAAAAAPSDSGIAEYVDNISVGDRLRSESNADAQTP